MHRARRFLPALFFMAVIFFFSSLPSNEVKVISDPFTDIAPRSIPMPASHTSIAIDWLKVGHVIGYLGLGAALFYAFTAFSRFAGWYSAGAALLYAASDEFHQLFTPGRHAGLNDVLLDTTAACAAILAVLAIRHWKRRRPG